MCIHPHGYTWTTPPPLLDKLSDRIHGCDYKHLGLIFKLVYDAWCDEGASTKRSHSSKMGMPLEYTCCNPH